MRLSVSPAATIWRLVEREGVFSISQRPESLRWKELLPVILSGLLPGPVSTRPSLAASSALLKMMATWLCFQLCVTETPAKSDQQMEVYHPQVPRCPDSGSGLSLEPRLLPSTTCCFSSWCNCCLVTVQWPHLTLGTGRSERGSTSKFPCPFCKKAELRKFSSIFLSPSTPYSPELGH